jgi:hypothetical protein
MRRNICESSHLGLKVNTTLRDLNTGIFCEVQRTYPHFEQPGGPSFLRRLCLRWRADLTGLEDCVAKR